MAFISRITRDLTKDDNLYIFKKISVYFEDFEDIAVLIDF